MACSAPTCAGLSACVCSGRVPDDGGGCEAGGCSVPSTFDLACTVPLETLALRSSRTSRIEFDTLDGLRLVVEPHAPGVFRVRCGLVTQLAEDKALSGRARAHQEMLLAREEAVGEATVETLSHGAHPVWRVVQGDVTLEISSHPVQLALYRGGTCVLASDVSQDLPALACDDAAAPGKWLAAFALDKGEAVYGLGETDGDLNRREQVIVSDDPSHRALPLAWSPRGWGLYANTLHRVEHALGAEPAASTYLLTVDDGVLDLFLFAGEPTEVLNQYSQLTGRAGQPVLWAMGIWLQQAPGATPVQTAQFAAGLRERQIPLDAVLFRAPAAWTFHEAKLNVEWDVQRFGDAKALLGQLHAHHLHACLPTFPGIVAGTPTFAELEDRGWLLADDDGNAHVFPGHPATAGQPFGLLDLTHRDVYNLWVERHRQLGDDGVDATACDVQIDIPDGVTARGGEEGDVLRTVYPLLARRALYEAVAGHKTPPEGVVWSRDLFPAAQRLPWQAGPAVPNTWEGFAQSLRTALSIGASGVPVQVHALGSAGEPTDGMTPELYVRWLTCNVFSANFSFQADERLMPWSFGDEVMEHVRTWLQWRYRLIPYVLGAIEDAARTGLPVQRSMAMCFPSDPDAHAWDTQYMLGPALLVAPPTGPGNEIKVYLPKGEAWWDLNTGWRYEGGTTWTVTCGLGQFPVFGREGHMLCLGPATQHTGDFNSARILDEVWMFGMPVHNPVVMRNKIRVMQMQGSSYIKGLEGLRIVPSEGLEVKRRGAEVRISRAR